MQILNIRRSDGEARIRITSSDDLIPLSNIIQEKDILIGKTERKIKLGGAEGRQKAIKKTITLEISVTKIVFDESNLRIQGQVTKSTADIPLNASHTIELSKGSEFKLKKQKWFKYQLDQLKQAEKNSQLPRVLLCVLDDEQANFGYLSASGVKPVGKLTLRLAKKRMEEKKKDEVKRVAKEIIERAEDMNIILASPLFWKELVIKSIKDISPKVAKKVILADVSTGSKKGLLDLVSSGAIDKLMKNAEISKNAKLVEKLLVEIAKDKLATYGLKHVENAAKSKSIAELLISEKLLSKSNANFDNILKIIELVEASKGAVHIIDKKSEAGKKLLGLSGIAAILKFKI
jgi:protein pelota